MPKQSANILIIDFDHSFVSSLSEFLTSRGYSVERCESMAALEAYRQSLAEPEHQRVELVITELNLDDESGLELLVDIKDQQPNMPVILTSEAGGIRDVVYALRKGADDYLLKPLQDYSIVIQVVEKSLKRGRLESQHAKAQIALKRLNTELRLSMDELKRDQTAGRLVQEKFHPPTPARLGAIDVSFEIIPSLYLSGDAIDYGFIGSRYLAFYLTDVSGHGSASAFVTVWVKQLVRGMFRDKRFFNSRKSFEEDIPRLMASLNSELLSANIGPHLTCLVGVIDTENLELNYVVGGHLPLPLLMQGNELHYLPGRGKPLGLFEEADWHINRCKLEEDFTLVVFSDGVLELFDEISLDEKEARLSSLLSSTTPSKISELKELLPLQNRDTVPDDVAMLLLRRNLSD